MINNISLCLLLCLIFSVTATAQELNCPEDTSQQEAEEADNQKTVFCQKFVEKSTGLFSPPEKVRVLHGPYEVYQQTDPVFNKLKLVKSGKFVDDIPTGQWVEYHLTGEIKSQFHLNEKHEIHGACKKFHPNGKISTIGQFDNGKPTGTWQFYSLEEKKLFEGSYEEMKKVSEAYDQELQKAHKMDENARQKARNDVTKKALEEVKKNWSIKTYNGSNMHFSKKDALIVSNFLGMMNWLDASANCRQRGMKLPTLDESIKLNVNGLCSVALNCGYPIWTETKRSNDTNALRNMQINTGEAWGMFQGQGMPSKLRDDLGVVCVR